MKYGIIFIFLLSIIFCQDASFDPEKYRNRKITAIKVEKPLIIDGILDEIIYQHASNTPYVQFEPFNGLPASEETEFWIFYDNDALYLGAMMYDKEPTKIIGNLSRRDNDKNSDFITIEIDSYHDKRSGFWFGINPSSSIMDGTIINDNKFSIDWDGIWDGASAINDSGWSAEMRIPFSQLRFNNAEENVMGVGLVRKIQRKEELDVFHYTTKEEPGAVSNYATLYGIKNIQPPKRLEATPYVTGSYSKLESQKDNPFYNGIDNNVNIGTDLKIGIGNNLTIDATINPDFGQVEVDPSVINLSAFETYYQEKRPFFIEGADIFRFGNGGPTEQMNFGSKEPTFFYSRRIGKYPSYGYDVEGDWLKVPSATSIYGASKLSGKISDTWSIGAISALTKREFAEVNIDNAISSAEVEPMTSYNLFRTLKEFNDGRQGLGVIATYVNRYFEDEKITEVIPKNSTVVGIDGWTFLNEDKDWAIGAWLGYSNVKGSKEYIGDLQQSSARYYQRPDADHVKLNLDRKNIDGYAGKVTINKETGRWNFNSAIQFITPGFETNDMGLNFRSDQINKHVSFGYKWLDPGKYFQNIGLNTAYMSNHNFAGNKTNEMVFFMGHARLANFWIVNPIIGIGPKTYSDEKLRGGPLVINPAGMWSRIFIKTDTRKPIRYQLGTEFQSSEENSYSLHISPGLEINLGTRLYMDLTPNFGIESRPYQYVEAFDDETATEMFNTRHIVAQMDRKTISADLRFDYTITPNLSIQAYVQPYISVGTYSHFKEFSKPKSYQFVEYGKTENFEIETDPDGNYNLYPNGFDGNIHYLYNPDFSYKSLVGSAVLRWEFRPGSTLYFVWTRTGSNDSNPGVFNFNNDIRDMFDSDVDNVFALKISYWIGK